MNQRNFIKSSVLSLLLGLAGCTGEKTAGTVTDTGNTLSVSEKVTGVVHRVDGSVASNAVVRMARMSMAEGLTIPDQMEVYTDSLGLFAFDSVLADTFQLAVIDAPVSQVFYLPRTTAGSNEFGSIQLSKAVVFSSKLYYEDVLEPAVPVGSHFTVSLMGTPFYQSVFAGDSFDLLIPEGAWLMEFYPGDPRIVVKLQESGVADSLIFRTWSLDSTVRSGDTLRVGPFIWSTTAEIDSLMKEDEKLEEDVSRISGHVLCKDGSDCAGVEVALITDLYGFEFVGDSLEFVAATVTDSTGRWWLPVPKSIPNDSFRVEYRLVKEDSVIQTGVSRYVEKDSVVDLLDTFDMGETTLKRPSGLISGVTLVIDREDSTQSSNCMVNSVVVGLKGTTHFIREVTCGMLEITGLPAGSQDIVLYSGDPKVVSVLMKEDVPFEDFVTLTHVTLPEKATQQQQWMTYTPPTAKTEK
ncbi:MAG: carboxypeptidase regulatory-like domain-containing protein [Fibrobacter sp.]|nr:carboxypeptidase regulatory-like domain-containing protein [Fibrobacter sp.]